MRVARNLHEAQSIADDKLKALAQKRLVEAAEADVSVAVITLELSDTAVDLEEALGFNLTKNRYTGQSFGDPDFSPSFELIEGHEQFYEIVFVLSDDGSGVIVLVPDHISVPDPLLAMCRHYAISHKESSP